MIDDLLESKVRAALRERAAAVSVEAPPVAVVVDRPTAPASAPLRWRRGLAMAAAVLTVIGVVRIVAHDDKRGLRVVGSEPHTTATTVPVARLVISDPRPLKARVVYGTQWGKGPQQLGFVPGDESVDSNPRAIAPSPDGKTVHIADNANNRVVSVDVATGRIVRTVPDVYADDLAVHPVTGAVFVLWGSNNVDRIDPDGTVTKLQAPGSGASLPYELAVIGGSSPFAGVYLEEGERLVPIPADSGPALPGWPVGDRFVSVEVVHGEMRLKLGTGIGAPDLIVTVVSEAGWEVGQVDDITVDGGRLLMVVSEAKPDQSTWRTRLLAFDTDGRMTAVHEAIHAEAEWANLTKVVPGAVFALDETRSAASLRMAETDS